MEAPEYHWPDTIEDVARGWESKSVEAQIESANERRGISKVRLTPEQAAEERKRDGLLLQRTRVLNQIENCRDERYRKTLTDGLAFLESQLARLGWVNPLPGGRGSVSD